MLLEGPVDLADVWHAAAVQQHWQLRLLPDGSNLPFRELVGGVDLEHHWHVMPFPPGKEDRVRPGCRAESFSLRLSGSQVSNAL
jgi:hypothetical protein